MPRFVILEHDWPTPHFDLMLESGATLRTWRLQRLPTCDQVNEALRIADHRLAYLRYEGPLSQGRGRVRQVQAGEYQDFHDTLDGFRVTLEDREFEFLEQALPQEVSPRVDPAR
jgi:hypothetical protein